MKSYPDEGWRTQLSERAILLYLGVFLGSPTLSASEIESRVTLVCRGLPVDLGIKINDATSLDEIEKTERKFSVTILKGEALAGIYDWQKQETDVAFVYADTIEMHGRTINPDGRSHAFFYRRKGEWSACAYGTELILDRRNPGLTYRFKLHDDRAPACDRLLSDPYRLPCTVVPFEPKPKRAF